MANIIQAVAKRDADSRLEAMTTIKQSRVAQETGRERERDRKLAYFIANCYCVFISDIYRKNNIYMFSFTQYIQPFSSKAEVIL